MSLYPPVSIRRADYWLVEEGTRTPTPFASRSVSIRRADYWLVEELVSVTLGTVASCVSIRRADYWLVEASHSGGTEDAEAVSIRRADYWLVEGQAHWLCSSDIQFQSAGRIIGWLKQTGRLAPCQQRPRFNPPGGLLVG